MERVRHVFNSVSSAVALCAVAGQVCGPGFACVIQIWSYNLCFMGDAGEGLIDAEARLQERMDELEESRKVAKDKGPKVDPETTRQTESLRLARTELQRQLELTTHAVRREQIGHAVAEIERRLAAVGTKKKK